MPGLNGAAYQINSWTNLHPELPGMLRDFAKAAIRTDPIDLLKWSKDYFRALSQGLPPPDKDRWEETSSSMAAGEGRPSGISVGLLRLLNKQLSSRPAAELTLNDVSQQWTSLGLERQRLDDLLELVSMATPHPEGPPPMTSSSIVEWNKLLALAAGQLGNSLGQTMEKLCVILSEDDDGGSSIRIGTFIEMYSYLANIDGDIKEDEIQAVIEYAGKVAQIQDGTINQYNLKSPLCPNLH